MHIFENAECCSLLLSDDTLESINDSRLYKTYIVVHYNFDGLFSEFITLRKTML